MSAKSPNPIDIHVGSRVRLRRVLVGMSQEKLGDQLGITFQQVQKYEKGTNRIGASRLFMISRILDVPVSFFYDDMPGEPDSEGAFEETGSGGYVVDFIKSNDGLQLNKAFLKIQNPRLRKKIVEMVSVIADTID